MYRNYSDFYLYLVFADNMKPTSMCKTNYKKHLYSLQLRKPWTLGTKTCVFREIIKRMNSPSVSATVDGNLVTGRQKDGVYFMRVL